MRSDRGTRCRGRQWERAAVAESANSPLLVWAGCASSQPLSETGPLLKVAQASRLRFWFSSQARGLRHHLLRLFRAFFDVFDDVADGLQFFRILVWHFD